MVEVYIAEGNQLLFLAVYIDHLIGVVVPRKPNHFLYRAYTIGSIGVASDPSLPKDPVPPVVALLVKLLGLGQISI